MNITASTVWTTLLGARKTRTKGRGGRLRMALVASLALSCAGAPFPRETRASVARSEDPWIVGEHCGDVRGETSVRVEDVEPGVGKPVERGETVRVDYVARLANGTTLHDSRDGGPPVEIIIGSTKTICGFEEGLVGMRPGGQRKVFVPWRLGFGEGGRAPDVQPRTDLVFVIDLFLPADTASEHGAAPVNPAGRGGARGRGR